MNDIVGMLPADGWRAVYAKEEPAESEHYPVETDELILVPLIAFACLMEIGSGEPEIVGMVPEGNSIVPCVSPTFIGYLQRDARLDSMLANLKQWKDAQKELAEEEQQASEILEEQAKGSSERPGGPLGNN